MLILLSGRRARHEAVRGFVDALRNGRADGPADRRKLMIERPGPAIPGERNGNAKEDCDVGQ